MSTLNRYHESLNNMPSPGYGCHPHQLRVANLGILAGKDPNEIHDDIRRSIPQGNRRVPDREITDTITKALADHRGGTFSPRHRPAPVVQDGKAALQRIISQGNLSDDIDLREASPIRLKTEPETDPVLLFQTIYKPDDLIWVGDRLQPGRLGDTIRTRDAWIASFQAGDNTAPHIIPNPLTGKSARTKSGDKNTMRGDGCVAEYRYCLAEFDNLSRQDQIRFWSAAKLPVVALIDSGGKSIHAWVDVQKLAKVTRPEEWQSEIKIRLYDRILKPLGVDGACSNPARLSRLPGHFRTEKGAFQRIIWLSAEGRMIC